MNFCVSKNYQRWTKMRTNNFCVSRFHELKLLARKFVVESLIRCSTNYYIRFKIRH